MKKNQSGVSLIALVITIIVVIILAAVAFGSSTDTITNANFSTFTNNLGEVRTAFQTVATTVKGNEAKNQITRTDAQVFNFVAKGGTLIEDSGDQQDTWLSRSQANGLACTQLSGDAMEKVLDMKLPTIKVNTDAGTGRQVSYFVTRTGTIFVWPPYEYEGKFYVTDTITVPEEDENDNRMYTAGYTFEVDGVEITTAARATAEANTALVDTGATQAELEALETVYYTDGANALAPLGAEATVLYDAEAGN